MIMCQSTAKNVDYKDMMRKVVRLFILNYMRLIKKRYKKRIKVKRILGQEGLVLTCLTIMEIMKRKKE